jgi:hypothetical protein
LESVELRARIAQPRQPDDRRRTDPKVGPDGKRRGSF